MRRTSKTFFTTRSQSLWFFDLLPDQSFVRSLCFRVCNFFQLVLSGSLPSILFRFLTGLCKWSSRIGNVVWRAKGTEKISRPLVQAKDRSTTSTTRFVTRTIPRRRRRKQINKKRNLAIRKARKLRIEGGQYIAVNDFLRWFLVHWIFLSTSATYLKDISSRT